MVRFARCRLCGVKATHVFAVWQPALSLLLPDNARCEVHKIHDQLTIEEYNERKSDEEHESLVQGLLSTPSGGQVSASKQSDVSWRVDEER